MCVLKFTPSNADLLTGIGKSSAISICQGRNNKEARGCWDRGEQISTSRKMGNTFIIRS